MQSANGNRRWLPWALVGAFGSLLWLTCADRTEEPPSEANRVIESTRLSSHHAGGEVTHG